MTEPLDQTIRDNAAGPSAASVDGNSVTQHNVRDQIEADRYLANKAAARKGLGVRMVKVVPPGA